MSDDIAHLLLQAPQAIIVAPTRELGVQIVMLIYKLLGGTTTARQPGDPANMFQYTGPKGIKVDVVLPKVSLEMIVADFFAQCAALV